MAKPECASLDSPPADVDGAIVHVRDQNWKQGGGDREPLIEPRFVKSWSLDGGATWGIPGPGSITDPSVPVQGQTWPGMTTYDFRGLIPTDGNSHEVLFEIAAGTHSRYVRTDGSVAYDDIEWGNRFAKSDRPESEKPVRFTVTVTNGAAPPPPPPVNKYPWIPLRDKALDLLEDAEQLMRDAGNTEKTVNRSRIGIASDVLRSSDTLLNTFRTKLGL